MQGGFYQNLASSSLPDAMVTVTHTQHNHNKKKTSSWRSTCQVCANICCNTLSSEGVPKESYVHPRVHPHQLGHKNVRSGTCAAATNKLAVHMSRTSATNSLPLATAYVFHGLDRVQECVQVTLSRAMSMQINSLPMLMGLCNISSAVLSLCLFTCVTFRRQA